MAGPGGAETARRRRRARRPDRRLVVWIAVGVAVRTLVALPLHRFLWEADSSLAGLGALRLLDGEPVVFLNAYRLGALGCWLTAAALELGASARAALAWVPWAAGVATLVAGCALARELLGARRARLAYPLFAVPPAAATFWTSMPMSYELTLLCCVAALGAAARVARRGLTPGRAAAFGLAAGVGFWTSPLTLAATVPAAAWIARARGRNARPAALAAAAAACLAGSAPWWAYNLTHGFPSLRSEVATRPASFAGAVDNLAYAVGTRLPELLAWTPPLRAYLPPRAVAAIGALAIVLWSAAAVAAAIAVARAIRSRARSRRLVAAGGLAAGVLGATLLLNAVSEVSSLREWTFRYVLPLAAVLPLVPPLAAGAGRRVAPAALVGALVLVDAGATFWPWHPHRRWLEAERIADEAVRARLAGAGVEAVVGSYARVYAHNYHGGRRVAALPVEAALDYAAIAAALPDAPLRWALLGRGPADREQLEACGPVALPGGTLERVGRGHWLWIGPEPAAGDARAGARLAAVRAACAELAGPAAPAASAILPASR